jgi:hypothetical protein
MKAGVTTRRKRVHERVVRMNLTFQPRIADALQALIRNGGYQGPSDYFAAKVRREARLDAEDTMAVETR